MSGFDASAYGPDVEAILALAERGQRLMPLVAKPDPQGVPDTLQRATASKLFQGSFSPEGALAGLWLYFGEFDAAHSIAQDLNTSEGSFWHAILHRREPDAGNSGYWFRRTGNHPVFPAIAASAQDILSRYPNVGFAASNRWDPFAFVSFCETVRDSGNADGLQAALEIQRTEWQILFDFCARAH